MFSLTHLHPMIVHFPIALVIFGFLAELASLVFTQEKCLPKISFYLLITGTLGALAAVLTGAFFTSELSGEAGAVRETHALLAFLTLGLLVATSALRISSIVRRKESKNKKRLAFTLYLLAVISVCATGFFGGTLVYSYMMPL
jgi:uncharacterized membrane protein